MESETKTCLNCEKSIKGRTDKKYCDENCRNNFNNNLKAKDRSTREINHVLARNRRVLQALIPLDENVCRVSREKLLQEGFQFKYFTHMYRTIKGSTYHFCYDCGYLFLSNEWLLLMRESC